jgi:hypothetical protein
VQPSHQRVRGEQHDRGHQHHDGGEGQDLAGGVGAGDEELGVPPHQVEDGLGDGHGGQADQHQSS